MYERFTDRARKVMQLANQEAQRFNHEYIGTEHVLLGLVKEGSGVAANVLKKIETLKGRVIPSDVTVSITRHYGETAAEKSNELLLHMGIAVFGVTLLILLFLGWRESVVVLLAIPVMVWFLRFSILRTVAALWIVDDPVRPVDAVVVLGGGAIF